MLLEMVLSGSMGERIYEVEGMGMRLVEGDMFLLSHLHKIDISTDQYWLPLHNERVFAHRVAALQSCVQKYVENLYLTTTLEHFRQSLMGRPVLFVSNHETAMESLVFCILGAYVIEQVVSGVAKEEHRNTRIWTIHEKFYRKARVSTFDLCY